MSLLGPDARADLWKKAQDYVHSEFGYQTTVDLWHETMSDTISNWRERYQPWTCETL